MKRVFVDTNVWVYAHDLANPAKRAMAMAFIDRFNTSPDIPIISTQVLQEFYNALTRKMKMDPTRARSELERLQLVETAIMTPPLIMAAAELSAEHTVSFWDALVISAAQAARCDVLYSEDLQTGRMFGAMEIVNPFLVSPGPAA